MSENDFSPEEANVDELSSKLNQGLRSCRSVVANYRSLLNGNDAETSSNDNDPSDSGGESLSGIDER